jgi:hypothetical protein
MEKPSPFGDIFAEEDTLGLLATKSAAPLRSSEEEIIVGQFAAINAFVDEHGYLPGSTDNGREPNLQEYALEGNLAAFRESDAYRRLLSTFDRHGLLDSAAVAQPPPTTIATILASDDALLNSPAEDIFTLKHVTNTPITKASPDDVAKRRPCADFDRFVPIFAEVKEELKSGKRIAKPFERENSVVPGAFFILNGIISYVADVDNRQRKRNDRETRIHVIFDNGMESNHLLRSFARLLYDDENGRQIIAKAPEVSGPLFTGQPDAGDLGPIKGTVYVVESLSEDPNIVALKGKLYKIGFTTQDVSKRLAHVEKDPTFLCSKVQLRATFETNFSPKKLEKLLHQFFAHTNFQVEVVLGRPVTPKEWFVVPLDVVEETVKRILDRSIVNYRYDHVSRKIMPR